MEINFYKYHGAGNDFIMIDGRDGIEISTEQVALMCHRRFGIGADGLIILGDSDTMDFTMTYYNSDGRESTMCGNGGRCIVAFAEYLGIFTGECIFDAIDGVHKATSLGDGRISLQMIDVEKVLRVEDGIQLDTGSPHLVVFVDDVDAVDVKKEGAHLRYNATYKSEGINVNFVEIRQEALHVRTYERGVEDETYACGTGVTASVIASLHEGKIDKDSVAVHVVGGDLRVSCVKHNDLYTEVYLEGPTAHVYKGIWEQSDRK